MKNITYYTIILLLSGAVMISCEQEITVATGDPCPSNDPTVICPQQPVPACPTGASKGSADFSKFVAIGSSFTAGFQAGALFTDGQNNSLPAILAKKFECVDGPATFNQPTIGTASGFNIFVTPNPLPGPVVLGRFRLQGTPPAPSPVVSDLAAIPNPTLNPSFLYTGNKPDLNNFAVPAVMLGQALIQETGNWAGAGVDPRFSPFYGRFASDPGTSTMLSDMITSLANGGTFFMNWLGMDDFLLYAVFGGDPALAPMTSVTDFTNQYNISIGAILSSNAELKGVVGNFPNIFVMPHFTAVPWNPIPLDAETAAFLNANLAANYNGFLDAMVGNSIISADEATKRKLNYTAGANRILLSDETLTDLTDYMTGPAAALLPFARARHSTNTDIIPLSTGSVLGTPKDDNPQTVWGVSYPVEDRHVLIPTESAAIVQRIADFNAAIKAIADANPTRLAYADVHKTIQDFVTSNPPLYIINGVALTPNINPPTGIYSEDGLHPNSRGYALLAGAFIDAINTRFGASVPKPNVGLYAATGLPINP